MMVATPRRQLEQRVSSVRNPLSPLRAFAHFTNVAPPPSSRRRAQRARVRQGIILRARHPPPSPLAAAVGEPLAGRSAQAPADIAGRAAAAAAAAAPGDAATHTARGGQPLPRRRLRRSLTRRVPRDHAAGRRRRRRKRRRRPPPPPPPPTIAGGLKEERAAPSPSGSNRGDGCAYGRRPHRPAGAARDAPGAAPWERQQGRPQHASVGPGRVTVVEVGGGAAAGGAAGRQSNIGRAGGGQAAAAAVPRRRGDSRLSMVSRCARLLLLGCMPRASRHRCGQVSTRRRSPAALRAKWHVSGVDGYIRLKLTSKRYSCPTSTRVAHCGIGGTPASRTDRHRPASHRPRPEDPPGARDLSQPRSPPAVYPAVPSTSIPPLPFPRFIAVGGSHLLRFPPPSPIHTTMASCAFVPTVAAGALVARSAAATSSRRPAAVPSARGVQMLMGGGKGNEAGGGKNPFGALGNMGNIMDAVKKAQQFTESAKELQDELKEVCHLPALMLWLCVFVGLVLLTGLRWSTTLPCSSGACIGPPISNGSTNMSSGSCFFPLCRAPSRSTPLILWTVVLCRRKSRRRPGRARSRSFSPGSRRPSRSLLRPSCWTRARTQSARRSPMPSRRHTHGRSSTCASAWAG